MAPVNVIKPNSNKSGPKKAMVLAAGLGKRMRPLTNHVPKPLVEVNGQTLLDHCLDALEKSETEEVVINVHYLADQIEEHVAKRESDLKVHFSDERDELLDSGGGIRKALPLLGSDPFYLLNADSFWIEGFQPNLARLADAWDDEKMDMFLLLSGMANAIGFASKGDFTMDPDGRLERRTEFRVAPFAYAGAGILHPRIFDNAPDGPFSLNQQFDEALEKQRLFGLRLDGLWLHVGTPEAIHEAEDAISRSAA